MTDLDIKDLAAAELTGRATRDADTVRLALSGSADAEGKTALEATMKQLHDEARRLGVGHVAVDFRALEFMNSSCFKVFVSWLAAVRDLPPDQQYRIHLISDPQQHWQRRSFAALACFAVDLVAIETPGTP